MFGASRSTSKSRDSKKRAKSIPRPSYRWRVTAEKSVYSEVPFSIWANSSNAALVMVSDHKNWTHHWQCFHGEQKLGNPTFQMRSGCRFDRETVLTQLSSHVRIDDKIVGSLPKNLA